MTWDNIRLNAWMMIMSNDVSALQLNASSNFQSKVENHDVESATNIGLLLATLCVKRCVTIATVTPYWMIGNVGDWFRTVRDFTAYCGFPRFSRSARWRLPNADRWSADVCARHAHVLAKRPALCVRSAEVSAGAIAGGCAAAARRVRRQDG